MICCKECGRPLPKPKITAERLRELIHYNKKTGAFTWRVDRAGKAKTGAIAGHTLLNGRRQIHIDGKNYKANRLAWLYMTGEWPKIIVDHRDGDPLNNRWRNLRLATHAQNAHNRKLGKNNTSGYKGVAALNGKWIARIRLNNKVRILGRRFDTAEEAYAAFVKAAKDHHGEFARVS